MTTPTTALPIGIFGRGRLASALAAALADESEMPPAWMIGRGETPPSVEDCAVNVAIDASSAEGVEAHLDWALDQGVDLVVAATGWRLPDLAGRVGERVGLVVAPNGSLTVVFLARLARLLAAFGRAHCGDAAGGYLLDHHHAAKTDAPSGTALRLARAWRSGADDDAGPALEVASLRAGYEVGKHVVGLDAPGEQLELVHRARTRAPFAHGLLRAAHWVVGRRGVFTLDDVARDAFVGTPLEPLFADSLQDTAEPIGDPR